MPILDGIAQQPVYIGIHHAHEWTICGKQGNDTFRLACLPGPEHVPVIMIIPKPGDAEPIGNYSGKENQQNGDQGFVV
jgi:hypothetical protein